MSALTLLKKAREIISQPEHWTQYAQARDSDGIAVLATEESATCFCAIGAVIKAEQILNITDDEAVFFNHLRKHMQTNSVAEFNDFHTHEEVLAAFDLTISQLEKETT